MNKRPHGQIRQSQLVTTFGPGAMMDLPNHAVLVGGLEDWSLGDAISEPRLADKISRLLEISSVQLRLPPREQEDPAAPKTGIKVWQFPEWFVTQHVTIDDTTAIRSRRLVNRKQLTKGR